MSRPDQPPPELLKPETEANVEALLATVRDLLAEENLRDQSFNSRGVGLAGFVGIVISLSITVGNDALKAKWGHPWKGLAVGLFAAALAAFLASVAAVVIGVLRPKESASLGISEVEKYPLPEYVYRPKVINQGTIMRGLVDALVIERARANSKARGLRWGYRLLIVGLVLISTLGFIVGLHDAKLIGVAHARRSTSHVATCRAQSRTCTRAAAFADA